MKKLFIYLSIIFFLGGCAHTNELMNYEIEGKDAFFEVFVAGEARTIHVDISTPKEEKKNKDEVTTVLEAVASVSSAVLSADKISKIKDWVDTEEIIFSVADGLKDALDTYVELNEVESKKDAQFLVETELEKCVLNVSRIDVHVTIQANAKIIDRSSGNIVWENWESDSVPVGYSNSSVKGVQKGTAAKVLTAIQLAGLSRREINDCVAEAAREVGRKMGETFREDLVESRQKD